MGGHRFDIWAENIAEKTHPETPCMGVNRRHCDRSPQSQYDNTWNRDSEYCFTTLGTNKKLFREKLLWINDPRHIRT